MSSTESNKLRNYSVALLHLLLNAPLYGAVNARPIRNPAPTEALVGKHSLTLFSWPSFVSLMKIKKPNDAPNDWSALMAEPNPFPKGPCALSDHERSTIAASISHLQQHCPNDANESEKGGRGGLGAWILKQINSSELQEFKTVWAKFCRQLSRPLNQHVDNALTEANISVSQLIQMDEDGVERGLEMIGQAMEMRMKVIVLEALFGEENMQMSNGMVDIPQWMNTTSNNIFNILKNRWRREHLSQKKALIKATSEADDAMEGMQCLPCLCS